MHAWPDQKDDNVAFLRRISQRGTSFLLALLLVFAGVYFTSFPSYA
jgi:hypothetical protein